MSINKYFPPRNGRKGHPMANKNFPYGNMDILKTADECDYISNSISERLPAELKKVDVYVTNPLFGEQIISLLNHPSFRHVYTYESDEELLSYLLNNLYLYGLSSRCTIQKGLFKGVPKDRQQSALYIDLSWVPVDKLDIFRISNKNVEQWIELSKSLPVITVTVKSSEKFPIPIGFIQTVDQDTDLKTFYLKPLHSKTEGERKKFIYDFLKIIIPKAEERELYVSPKNMKIWTKAFTHESVDRINSYEDLELLGDAVIDLCFKLYVFKLQPTIDKEDMSNLRNYYLSVDYLPSLTRKYNFVEYIDMKTRPKAGIFEDVFESFFGALYNVAENVQKNSGFTICQKMFDHIFGNIELDKSRSKLVPKSYIGQIVFRKFKLEEPVEEDYQNKNYNETTININSRAIELYGKLGFKFPSDGIIGRGRGVTKTVSRDRAWDDALDKIIKMGLTTEYINRTSEMYKFQHIPNYEKVREKYTKEGLKGIKIQPIKDSKGTYLQLIGTADLIKYKYNLGEQFAKSLDYEYEYEQLFEKYLRS